MTHPVATADLRPPPVRKTRHFPSLKYVRIAEDLGQQIEARKYKVGDKLPPERELADSFGVAFLTMRQALSLLSSRGLLERVHGRGTFVRAAEQRALLAVLLGTSSSDETGHYDRAVARAIQQTPSQQNCLCRVYDGLGEFRRPEEIKQLPNYLHLEHDLRRLPFSGIIEIGTPPESTAAREALTDLPIARTLFDVRINFERFGREAIEFFVRQERRKVFYLRSFGADVVITEDLDGFNDAARELRLPAPRVGQLETTSRGGYHLESTAYERTLQLVDQWRADDSWPDGLLVSDDIVMRGVALALVRRQVDVPEKLLVVCLTNEGINHHYGIPVVRYEISPAQIAKELLRILWLRIAEQTLPPLPVLVGGGLANE